MYIDRDDLITHFFKVFGIEPKWKDKRVKNSKTYYTKEQAQYLRETTKNRNIQLCYPEISDRKLLEMICIFSQHCNFGRWNKYAMHSIDDFKYIMLSQLIEYQNKRYTYGIKEKIQQLFKDNQ